MSYKIYTTEFDQIITARQLAKRDLKATRPVNGYVNPLNMLTYESLSNNYFDQQLPDAAANIANNLSLKNLSRINDTVITILVDHSGSLIGNGGKGSIIARLALELLSGAFCLMSVKHEILGFTTKNWQGGSSRRKWEQNGRPPNPGRLCDLLHIIYRSHDDELIGPNPYLSNLFRRDLLKENIDGEAIEWAVTRLKDRSEKRKILVIMSDGVPIDDSTLMENPESFLSDHCSSILEEINLHNEIELSGIGVNYALDGWFSDPVFLSNEDTVAQQIFSFIEAVLGN